MSRFMLNFSARRVSGTEGSTISRLVHLWDSVEDSITHAGQISMLTGLGKMIDISPDHLNIIPRRILPMICFR